VLDLSHQDDLRWLAQLLTDMRSAAPSAELLLVGALARDLLLHYGHGIAIERATEDVDFGLAVKDWREFDYLRQALLAGGPFAPDRGAIHKLRYREQVWIDLIPFGAVEQPDGTIAWPPDGEDVMGVLGYLEANATATRVQLPQAQVARTVSLPMLAVLKLLTWRDRHGFAPKKDAADLTLILRNYLNAGNTDRLYTDMAHLLTDAFDFEATGAWLVGRDARTQIQQYSIRSDSLLRTLVDVLHRELDLDGRFTLITDMSLSDPERAQRLLAAFHSGLIGAEAP
jgi:predicted nucleotidyltransferase